jgi:arylsulfatase A-like enzyme
LAILSSNSTLAPTALAAAGVEAKDANFDGVNLLPYFKGQLGRRASGIDGPHETLYWRFGEQMAIRHGDYKLVKGVGVDQPQLFDLATDIGEKKDMSAEKPEIYKDLTSRYEAWNKTLEAPRWVPVNAAKKAAKQAKKAAKAKN